MAQLQASTVAGNTLWHAGNYGRVISRGNPGSASPLALSLLGEAHYYYATGVNTIEISTTMVENSVYELCYTTTGSGNNIDIVLQPNYTTYASAITEVYWGSMPSASPSRYEFVQTQSQFYFDHQNGGAGNTPCGRFYIFNFRAKKQVLYHGGDTNSVCFGSARWNDSTTQWSNVGTLAGLNASTNVKAYVRRIG